MSPDGSTTGWEGSFDEANAPGSENERTRLPVKE